MHVPMNAMPKLIDVSMDEVKSISSRFFTEIMSVSKVQLDVDTHVEVEAKEVKLWIF